MKKFDLSPDRSTIKSSIFRAFSFSSRHAYASSHVFRTNSEQKSENYPSVLVNLVHCSRCRISFFVHIVSISFENCFCSNQSKTVYTHYRPLHHSPFPLPIPLHAIFSLPTRSIKRSMLSSFALRVISSCMPSP